MRSLTWGCGQEEDPAGSSGGRRIQRCLPGEEGPRSAGTPRAIPAGRRIQQPLPQEGASAGRGSGEEDPAKSFHGGRRERGNPTVCVPGSQRDPRAGGGGIPRLSPCPPQGSGRDPGGRRGAGQPRRRRVPGEPQQRLGQGRSVRRSAEGEGGDAAPLAVSPARSRLVRSQGRRCRAQCCRAVPPLLRAAAAAAGAALGSRGAAAAAAAAAAILSLTDRAPPGSARPRGGSARAPSRAGREQEVPRSPLPLGPALRPRDAGGEGGQPPPICK